MSEVNLRPCVTEGGSILPKDALWEIQTVVCVY